MTGYDLYCQWCRDHNRKPPTSEWWDWAVNQPKPIQRRLDRDQEEIDTERREGWAYDK